jgi:hypothetical protein
MTFARDGQEVGLFWRKDSLRALQHDRAVAASLLVHRTVLGHPAQVIRYQGDGGWSAIWRADRVMELRAQEPSLQAFEQLLASLRIVDEQTWEAALPASSVTPSRRPAAVDRMLAGVPLPPGFDVAPLKTERTVRDEYQLGAEVTGAVSCAWIQRWDHARKRGDTGAAQDAVAAMQTSHHWKVLTDMGPQGGWSSVLWDFADHMRGKGLWYGRPLVGDAREGLGCIRWWG